MKNVYTIIGLTIIGFVASACSPHTSSVADFESSQMNAKRNCQSNGEDYLAQSGITDTKYVFDTDSSITRTALQGDGWCSATAIVSGIPDNSQKLWCRSSKGQGCKTIKPLDDGKPNPNLDQSTPIQK
jgi:hypothetical protein